MDVWVCYDYRQLAFDETLDRYEEVHLVAWSLGVWVAERLMPRIVRATSGRIRWTMSAINGTGRPVDDRDGIPEAIFRGTLEQLDEAGLARFIRRMCGTREHLAAYKALPARPLAEVREELQSLYDAIRREEVPERLAWTHVWLSRADRIFPIDNLRHYWRNHPAIRETDTPHEPFNQWEKWEALWS